MAEERKVIMNNDEGSSVEAPKKKKTINIVLTKDSLSLEGKEGKVDLKKFESKK